MMNDEEFKKKLEKILEDFYQIDREVKDYLEKKRLKSREDVGKSYGAKKLDIDGKYKDLRY